MNSSNVRVTSTQWRQMGCAGIVALGWVLTAGAADTVSPRQTGASAAERLYQSERSQCASQREDSDRQACLTDARAAYGEARRGVLGQGQTLDPAYLTQRCQALPVAERPDCAARMNGKGTTSGSVRGGGIYRELKTYSTEAPASAPIKP